MRLPQIINEKNTVRSSELIECINVCTMDRINIQLPVFFSKYILVLCIQRSMAILIYNVIINYTNAMRTPTISWIEDESFPLWGLISLVNNEVESNENNTRGG